MRKILFLSSLISLFSLAEPVQNLMRQKPLVSIVEEEELKNNSFFNKNLKIRFETELKNDCLVKIRGQKLPEENVQFQKHCVHCTQPIIEGNKIKMEIADLEDYLQNGMNAVEITAANGRNKTTKKINIEIGGAVKNICGIEFELCRRAEQNYLSEKEKYKKITGELNRLNKMFPKAEIKKITIQYEHVCGCNCSTYLEKGGSTNAMYDFERIVIGYGNINKCKKRKGIADLIRHEYGHGIFIMANEEFNKKFRNLHTDIKDNHPQIFGLFTESNYVQDKEFGHPQDHPTELFASAFTIKMSHYQEFQKKLQNYTPEEQGAAKKVMELLKKELQYQNK